MPSAIDRIYNGLKENDKPIGMDLLVGHTVHTMLTMVEYISQ